MKKKLITLVLLAIGSLLAGPVFGSQLIVGGFETPESVLHDTAADVYLVSNVGVLDWDNGGPAKLDNNGSISRVNPLNGAVQHDWISGGSNGVTLHAPKGMGIYGNVLYVADVNTLRLFNRTTGMPIGAIAIPNPFAADLFLNDVAVTSNGTVFVSDSENNAIFKVTPGGQASVWSVESTLGFPNGMVAEGTNGVAWVTWYGSPGQILRMGANRKISVAASIPRDNINDPDMGLDGLARKADGSFLVSSWATGKIYHVSATGAMLGVVAQYGGAWELGPADIGVDQGRNRLLVPLFLGDVLVIEGF